MSKIDSINVLLDTGGNDKQSPSNSSFMPLSTSQSASSSSLSLPSSSSSSPTSHSTTSPSSSFFSFSNGGVSVGSLNDNTIDIVFKVLSIVLTFVSLLYSAFSATGVSASTREKIEVATDDGYYVLQKNATSDTPNNNTSSSSYGTSSGQRSDGGAGAGDEDDGRSEAVKDVSYWRLNLVMVLASMHVAAVLCGWGFNDVSALGGFNVGIGYSAMGFKCASHYLCVLFYVWVLTNPYIGPVICPDREWPSTDVED